MSINWPIPTSIGELHPFGGNTWIWNGESWDSLGAYIQGPNGNGSLSTWIVSESPEVSGNAWISANQNPNPTLIEVYINKIDEAGNDQSEMLTSLTGLAITNIPVVFTITDGVGVVSFIVDSVSVPVENQFMVSSSNIIQYDILSGPLSYVLSYNIAGTTTTSAVSATLPVPKIKSVNGMVQISAFDDQNNTDGATLDLYTPIVVTTMDLSQEQINSGVWLEMLIYSKKRGNSTGNRKSGYVIPTSWVDGKNTLHEDIGVPLPTRGGESFYFDFDNDVSVPLGVDRLNHVKILNNTQRINAWEYLNGRWCLVQIEYRDINNNSVLEPAYVPASGRRRSGDKFGKRFAYSPVYTPMYIAFRYIMWNQEANLGSGQFISGPISNIVKVTPKYHAFLQNSDATSRYGEACCIINPEFIATELKCTIETKLP
jgi:hypothetical protein